MLRPLALPALAGIALAACATPASSSRPAAKPPPPTAAAVPPPAPPPPIRPEALVAGARALRAAGDLAHARELLEAATRTSPGSDDARLELADLLVADGREIDRAGALLDGVRDRSGAQWNIVAAHLAELRGDDAGAVDAYARALAVADDPDERIRRALALDRLGRSDEATAELERVRADRPRDALVRARLGERYEAAGRLAEAESEFRAAAESQPERAAGWEQLARFYQRAGRTADANAALARAREAGARPARSGRVLRPLLPSKM